MMTASTNTAVDPSNSSSSPGLSHHLQLGRRAALLLRVSPDDGAVPGEGVRPTRRYPGGRPILVLGNARGDVAFRKHPRGRRYGRESVRHRQVDARYRKPPGHAGTRRRPLRRDGRSWTRAWHRRVEFHPHERQSLLGYRQPGGDADFQVPGPDRHAETAP